MGGMAAKKTEDGSSALENVGRTRIVAPRPEHNRGRTLPAAEDFKPPVTTDPRTESRDIVRLSPEAG
jgi:hypothetical protein